MLFNNQNESPKTNNTNSIKQHDSFPVLNNQSDSLTLNNLAQSDPMFKQLHERELLSTEPSVSSYSLFNKNFTTFMKYTDSNLDINMALSSSNNNKQNDSNYTMADVVKTDTTSISKEIRLNDMLAATSLTKDSTMTDFTEDQKYSIKPLTDNDEKSTCLKRQNNCLNQNLNQEDDAKITTSMNKSNRQYSHEAKNEEPSNNEETSIKEPVSKQIQLKDQSNKKNKILCNNSSSSSSTCSNSSNSSKSSSRTDSSETPKLTSQNQNQVSRQTNFQTKFNSSNQKYSSSSSSSSTSSSSTASANSNKASLPFNIENELIKYTKNLKLNNRHYTDVYRLGAHIRNGGFSEIYDGYHNKRQSEKFIIKLIPKRKTKNWLMVHNKKYPAEILLHKMCNHIDGVVEMSEFFEQENDWIIVMPKLDNCLDLFDYLESKQRGRLSEAEACHFFVQLIKINIELLNHGVVHRDIKSENILVDLNTMKLILIDFGASAICRNKPTGSIGGQHHYTDFHGTRQYKPPEYIMHKKYTAQASTIWTLGILLFDMCNGQLPFETEQEIIEYNLQMKAPVSDEYKVLLNNCLKTNPNERPNLTQLLEFPWCVNNLKVDIKDL